MVEESGSVVGVGLMNPGSLLVDGMVRQIGRFLRGVVRRVFSRRFLGWCFGVVAVLGLGVVVTHWIYNARAEDRWEKTVAEWESYVGELDREAMFPAVAAEDDFLKDPYYVRATEPWEGLDEVWEMVAGDWMFARPPFAAGEREKWVRISEVKGFPASKKSRNLFWINYRKGVD